MPRNQAEVCAAAIHPAAVAARQFLRMPRRGENLWRMNMRKMLSLAALVVLMNASWAVAAEGEVKMLNKGAGGCMVSEPALIKIEPGDTVKFVASDKSHNAESIKNMLPAGSAPFAGQMSGDASVTFDKPGASGVKCMPHYAMGMVGLIVVGKPDNL